MANFNGQDAGGDWTLTVTDDKNRQVGTLDSWSLHFTGIPAVNRPGDGNAPNVASTLRDFSERMDTVWSRVARARCGDILLRTEHGVAAVR